MSVFVAPRSFSPLVCVCVHIVVLYCLCFTCSHPPLPHAVAATTWCVCSLVNEDVELLAAHYDLIQSLSATTLFDVEGDGAGAPAAKERAVVVVDPFSTGARVAAYVNQKGLRCVCVYSDHFDSIISNLVPHGVQLHFDETVQYDAKLAEEEALEKAVKALAALPWEVAAVIPGAEMGVELADKLSDRMGLRTNGASGCEVRSTLAVLAVG